MKKLAVVFLGTALLASTLWGCTNKSADSADTAPGAGQTEETAENTEVEDSEGEQASETAYTVAFTVPTMNNPFFVDQIAGAQKAADERGIELISTGADNDVTQQIQQIEDYITQEVDGMIVHAVDTTGIVTGIEALNSAEIPVVTTAEKPTGGEVTCAVTWDNYQDGYNAGTYIAEALGGSGKVCELSGVAGQQSSREKSQGFQDAIAEYPDIELLGSQPAQFDRAIAMSVMENFLQSFEEINAVYASNDEMALGAIQAIKAADRMDEIMVMGNDGTADAISAIEAGEMAVSNATPPYIQGYCAVDMMYRALQGEDIPDTIIEQSTIITKDNLDEADHILFGVDEEDWYWVDQF